VTAAAADAAHLPHAGLCASCVHVKVVTSSTGSTFVRCSLAATDRRFAKYPRLPVVACPGYVADADRHQ
jgi:hypothetical protein